MPKQEHNYLQDPYVVGGGTVQFGPAALADPPAPQTQAEPDAARPEPRRDRFERTPEQLAQDRRQRAQAEADLSAAQAENERARGDLLAVKAANGIDEADYRIFEANVARLVASGTKKSHAYTASRMKLPMAYKAWLKKMNEQRKGQR